MAVGDSKVTVKIEGDADGLSRELKKADRGLAGLGQSTKGLLAAGAFVGVTAGAIEFGTTAVQEADRVGDATTRLELQLGDLSDKLVDTADEWAHLGQSKQDMLELEARVADVATALGIADPLIADFADEAAATAAAIELLGGADAATNIDLIGRAAGGNQKALKELGIILDEDAVFARALADTGKDSVDALTEGEIAAARYKEILEKLKPKLDDVAKGNGDVEQSTRELQAKFETFTGVVGEKIEGPLNNLLTWLLTTIEKVDELAGAISSLEEPMTAVGEWADDMKQNFREALGPIQQLIDAATFLIGLTNPLLRFTGLLETAQDEVSNFQGQIPSAPGGGGGAPSNSGGGGGGSSGGTGGGGTFVPQTVNINVAPTGGADLEKAVVTAIRDYNRRNGIL